MNLSRSLRLIRCLLLIAVVAGGQQVADAQTITVAPNLYPAFNPVITDYIIGPSQGATANVTVNAPVNMTVSVDGQAFATGSFQAQVNNLSAGQKFTIVVKTASSTKKYYVRRTPIDLPTWTTERVGTPQAEYFIFAPVIRTDFGEFRNYVVVADNYGVPIWWYRANYHPIDAKLMPGGRLGWMTFAQYPGYAEFRTLDSTVTQTVLPAAQLGGSMDVHEILQLPNGNYLFISGQVRGPVDLRNYGGSINGYILDNVIEEVTPRGALVWHWSPMDHIPFSETGQGWRGAFGSNPVDCYHMNSVEIDEGCRLGSVLDHAADSMTGPGYIISMRHQDAIFRIDKASGAITWKLGGVRRAESLTYVGDPHSNFSGNHDARVHTDGSVSLHDNGTLAGRAPRAVRYRINTSNRTATLLEQITDENVGYSGCCGSARRLPGGNWVMEWGATPSVTERAPNSSLVFRMSFLEPFFSYRADAVPYGKIKRANLRQGMDDQYPR